MQIQNLARIIVHVTHPTTIVILGVAICLTASLWYPLNNCGEVSAI